jgi:hypothetical protein
VVFEICVFLEKTRIYREQSSEIIINNAHHNESWSCFECKCGVETRFPGDLVDGHRGFAGVREKVKISDFPAALISLRHLQDPRKHAHRGFAEVRLLENLGKGSTCVEVCIGHLSCGDVWMRSYVLQSNTWLAETFECEASSCKASLYTGSGKVVVKKWKSYLGKSFT